MNTLQPIQTGLNSLQMSTLHRQPGLFVLLYSDLQGKMYLCPTYMQIHFYDQLFSFRKAHTDIL